VSKEFLVVPVLPANDSLEGQFKVADGRKSVWEAHFYQPRGILLVTFTKNQFSKQFHEGIVGLRMIGLSCGAYT
jgi:hypothetical protein